MKWPSVQNLAASTLAYTLVVIDLAFGVTEGFSAATATCLKAVSARVISSYCSAPDAASEGLNLQRLGTLINIDLPWNPTRLEQRKGRIQRIGQVRTEIWIANLRYRGSVEDRVHQVLADRLEAIHNLFGQIPDTLEDVWVQIALNDEEAANQLIDRTTATRNPFDKKYSKVEDADWETCASVLNHASMRELLSRGW